MIKLCCEYLSVRSIWLHVLIMSRTRLRVQPVVTTKIYDLHKITIALKFMSYINFDLPIPAKKLQTPG